MMKKFIDILRMTFLSWEFVSLLLFLGLYIYFPSLFEKAFEALTNKERSGLFYGSFLALSGSGIAFAFRTAHPFDRNSKLYQSEFAYMLKNRIALTLVYLFVCPIVLTIFILAQDHLEDHKALAGAVIAWITSSYIIAYGHILFAQFTIRAILEEHPDFTKED